MCVFMGEHDWVIVSSEFQDRVTDDSNQKTSVFIAGITITESGGTKQLAEEKNVTIHMVHYVVNNTVARQDWTGIILKVHQGPKCCFDFRCNFRKWDSEFGVEQHGCS